MKRKQDIGINQRIPIPLLELALRSALQGEATADYFSELAAMEYNGPNRIGKAVSVFNRLTTKSPLWPYVEAHRNEVEQMLRSRSDRPVLFAALICAAYGFGYDVVALLGKFFHAQDEVTTELIKQKMALKYGANRSLPNALYCVLPMLIEAGLIERPVPGIYKARYADKTSDAARMLYREAFLLNNPMLTANDMPAGHSFFEFIA